MERFKDDPASTQNLSIGLYYNVKTDYPASLKNGAEAEASA